MARPLGKYQYYPESVQAPPKPDTDEPKPADPEDEPKPATSGRATAKKD
jgi:hypothetical protein